MEFKEQLKKYQTIINTELEKYLRKDIKKQCHMQLQLK